MPKGNATSNLELDQVITGSNVKDEQAGCCFIFGNPDSCKQQTTSLNLIVFTLELHLWDLAVKRYKAAVN